MPLRQREEIQEVLFGQSLKKGLPPPRVTTLNSKLVTLNRIAIHGARQHDLKNISLAIPREKFVVVSGGSGKRTLTFDLITSFFLPDLLQGTISTA